MDNTEFDRFREPAPRQPKQEQDAMTIYKEKQIEKELEQYDEGSND